MFKSNDNVGLFMEKIKLVIWDLDDTFWEGTLSEGDIRVVHENIEIVKILSTRGIINSVVSKNNYDTVKKKLIELGIWEYFVFPKVSWNSKGNIIKDLIEELQLRPINVLFLDDNTHNLNEAKFYLPELNVRTPDFIQQILTHSSFQGKDDSNLSRLEHYRLLERKNVDKVLFSDNKEFLEHSEIRIIFIEDFAKDDISRIHELIHRTNQLNYTKKRISIEELSNLINRRNDFKNLGVKVIDKYGDYGIVGFASLNKKEMELEHFLFSCRILNLGIEQFVYCYLGFPKLMVQGEIATELSKEEMPDWIKVKESNSKTQKNSSPNVKILLKGGCDLGQMIHYLNFKNILVEEEFNYVSKYNFPIHREHTMLIKEALTVSENEKETLLNEKLPFLDEGVFETKIFDSEYDILIYSLLMDYTQPIYQHKNTLIQIPFGSYFDLNKQESDFLFKIYPELGFEACMRFFETMVKKFTYKSQITPETFIDHLSFISDKINKPIIFINGAELESPKENSLEKGAKERHILMNKVLEDFVERTPNTYLLDVRKLVRNQNDITNNIRHYSRNVYKEMAESLIHIISEITEVKAKKSYSQLVKNKLIRYKTRLFEMYKRVR